MRNIILAGFMGTGKTTVGQLVADRLGLIYIDTDTEIEQRAGRRIADIFATDGEPAFRALEAEVCLSISRQHDQVVSTGGGALLNRQVYETFAASGLLIGLQCDLDEIIRRVGNDPLRPLFVPDRDKLARLLDSRAALYNSLPYQIDTTHRTPLDVTNEVVQLWTPNP